MFHLSLARSVSSVAIVGFLLGGSVRAQVPIAATAGPSDQTPAGAVPAQSPAQLREELQRLRQEFESIRDVYGARLAALEARLSQPPGDPATPAPPATAPAEAAAPAGQTQAPEVAVPAGAAGAGGPSGALPVYGNASAMSKIFNPDIAVIGNFVGAAGQERDRPASGAVAAGRGRSQSSRRSSIPTRAPTSSLPSSPEGSGNRGRLPDVYRRCRAGCC